MPMRIKRYSFLLLIPAMISAGGCGYSSGEALFMFGLFKRPTIEAEFKLTENQVAVLVDDTQEIAYWRETRDQLAEAVSKELAEKKAAKKVVSLTRVKHLRQLVHDYEDLSIREIGEKLDAEQVVSIQITAFEATLDPASITNAASMQVAVKVINVLEKKRRSKVRLWPMLPEGKTVRVELSAADVNRAKNRRGLIKELTNTLAVEIVKNFYDRKQQDFE